MQNNIVKPIISQLVNDKLDNLTQFNYFLKIYSNYENYLINSKNVRYDKENGKILFLDSSSNILNSVSANYSDYLLLKNTIMNAKNSDSLIQNYISGKITNLPQFTD